MLKQFLLSLTMVFSGSVLSQELTGWALLPAATFASGPTSGQFASPNNYGTNRPPFVNQQPVQGFSAVLRGPSQDRFILLVDNGFGAKANSADSLLRAYSMKVNWSKHSIEPSDLVKGRKRNTFDSSTQIEFNDANRQLTFAIQADYVNYYNDPKNVAVDPSIRSLRLLTGADLDPESLQKDRQGNYWIGDEFGPYLIKTNAKGTVLRSQIPLPGVYAPENADVLAGKVKSNLPGSGGFEGMTINKSKTKLITLLEKGVAGDPAKMLRLNEFDLASESFTSWSAFYPLEGQGTNIGDIVAVDDKRLIVIERNGDTATVGNPFKKLFLIDLSKVSSSGVVAKEELVDLMAVNDPRDLNGDGSKVFSFPFVTIENVLVLSKRELLVVNDNNFPYGGGRSLASDNTEFLRIKLNKPLY